MNSDYIVNGKVVCNRIARDISRRKLDRQAIERLISDPVIASAFRGDSFDEKRPKKEWNGSYLEELSCAAIAESFNRDYLLYLDEVANFVTNANTNAKFRKIIIAGIIIALVIMAGVIVSKVISAKTESIKKPENIKNTESIDETDVSVITNIQEAAA